MPSKLRSLAVLALIALVIIPSCGRQAPANPDPGEPGETPSQNDPVIPEEQGLSLVAEWEQLRATLGLTDDSAFVRELTVSYEPDAGVLRSLQATFIVPASSHRPEPLRYHVRRLEESGEYQWSESPIKERATETHVPLVELFSLIDSVGLANLSSTAGEYSSLTLQIGNERGRTLGPAAMHANYLLYEGKAESINDQWVVVGGLNVILRSFPVGDRSGETDPDRKRQYLVVPLSGEVDRVELAEPKLTPGEEWLDTKLADLEGDGRPEAVYFVGKKSDPNLPAADEKRLIIAGDGLAKSMVVPPSEGFYGTELQLRDMTRDGQLEFLFFEFVGGTGNVVHLNVFELNQKDESDGSGLVPLFLANEHWETAEVVGQFLPGELVRLSLPSQGIEWEYPLHAWENAPRELNSAFTPGIDPFSDYELGDFDGDGTIEIAGYQLVSGVAHVDAIAMLRRVFSWNGTTFSQVDLQLFSFDESWQLQYVEPTRR